MVEVLTAAKYKGVNKKLLVSISECFQAAVACELWTTHPGVRYSTSESPAI